MIHGQGGYLKYLIIIWNGDHPIRMDARTIRMEINFKQSIQLFPSVQFHIGTWDM